MRIAAVDLVSNTCFPLLAADELGLFEAEGLDVEIELLPALRGRRLCVTALSISWQPVLSMTS